jgi:hypothetical protein
MRLDKTFLAANVIMINAEVFTHVKQGWISYLQSLETTLLENLQKQKDKVMANVQEEMLETKQIEEHIIKQKDTFEYVEKHGSDKQAFLLTQTLKTDPSPLHMCDETRQDIPCSKCHHDQCRSIRMVIHHVSDRIWRSFGFRLVF